MPLFDLPPRSDVSSDKAIAKKAKSSKRTPTTVRGGGGIASLVAQIKATVNRELGKYEDETLIIRDEQTLHDYITKAIEYGEIAIDTETTGLDPLLDECVGIGLYVPNEKTTYTPMNHVSYITMEKIDNQLPKEVVARELERLNGDRIPFTEKVKIIFFNAVFDIRVIKNRVGVTLTCYWDCKVASVLMNENEDYGEGGLKPLHLKYVHNGVGDAFAFDDLFDPKRIKFNLVPIREGGLYAAHDPKITYELYAWQKNYIYYDPTCAPEDRNGLNGVSWVFFNIEMPIVNVVVDMEDTGIALDTEYAKELEVKYNKLKEEASQKVYDILEEYQDKIKAYKGDKLDNPINLGSPTQLAILLYDILGYQSVDKKKPRGTGKAILQKWKTPLANAIFEYKKVDKLLTFITKLPKEINPKDGRVHGRFNATGTKTGRFSSKNPNLQQIPSHNKDIRPMFVATHGETIVEEKDDSFTVDRWCEVETPNGWRYADKIKSGDQLLTDEGTVIISSIIINPDSIVFKYKGGDANEEVTDT
jgi:DNA polymerase-1